MARLQVNNVGTDAGTINPITIASATATTCSWTSAPTHMPAVAAPDVLPITVSPNTPTTETIIWVTGYSPGATTASILQNPPGESSFAAAHSAKPWIHGPTALDFRRGTGGLRAALSAAAR